jgi:hypothetical protein
MRRKVLIVESNAPLAELWRAYLVKHGFDAICAIDGVAPSSSHGEWGIPDIIVSGLDFTRHIPSASEYCFNALGRKPATGKLIPVIQFFGSHIPDTVKDSLKGSAFKLLAKPVTLHVLLSAVREARFEAVASFLRSSGTPTAMAKLEGHSLFGMLQDIDSNKKSGALLVETVEGNAWILFNEAAIIDASCGSLSGEEAILEILSWSNGTAFLHESSLSSEALASPLSGVDVKALLDEAFRQRDIIDRAKRLISSPSAILQRNPSARISGKAHFADRIYIALESPCDFESLVGRIKGLSRRQLLVALSGMVERGEIVVSSSSPSKCDLKSQTLRLLAGKLLDASSCQEMVSSPPAIAVVSFTPRAAMSFLGAACGLSVASTALVSGGGRRNLLLCERSPAELCSDSPFAGVIFIFDRNDSNSIGAARDFFAKSVASGSQSSTLVLVPRQESKDASFVPVPELLGLKGESSIFQFEFTRQSCAAAIAELLGRIGD